MLANMLVEIAGMEEKVYQKLEKINCKKGGATFYQNTESHQIL
jgi:hypothetical protein